MSSYIMNNIYTGAIAVYYAQWPASIKNACGPKIIARHVAIIATNSFKVNPALEAIAS